MGLATAYSIIRKHNGDLSFTSKSGEGTVFTIILPTCNDFQENNDLQDIQISQLSGKVLILEDDDEIRRYLKAFMEKLGLESVLKIKGEDILEAYQAALSSDSPFNLVLMDLTIPDGMSGEETMEKLLQMDPNVKAIVSSGYSNNLILSNFADYGFLGVIQKPYSLQNLYELLASYL